MVAIAVDRYFLICHPLVGALTGRTAWVVTAVLGVFAAAIGVCVALMYSVRHYVPSPHLKQLISNHSTSIEATVAGRQQYLTSDDEIMDYPTSPTSTQPVMVEVNAGVCNVTNELFSTDFIWYFQKVYNGLFLVSFVTVVVLYAFIYRSVLQQRSRRQRKKVRSLTFIASHCQRLPLASQHTGVVEQPEAVELQLMEAGVHETTRISVMSISSDAANLQAARERKRNRVANLKTAGTLFVVTIVFVVTFLPAFLMTLRLIPYNAIVFYMYFANNVANPIIYSFMNHNFRSKLESMIFCRHSHGQLRPNFAAVTE